jgi:large subunit ribosomal protein L13
VERKWHIVDAEGIVLGRLAAEVAKILRGKHKPMYTPHMDTGDFVIVTNAEKVRLTGQKDFQKIYRTYSGYPGGEKTKSADEVREEHPERLIEHAVKGMLPSGTLGREMFKKLKVYAGAEHPHQAQQPEPLDVQV